MCPARGQHLGRKLDGVPEVPGHLRQRGHKQIAEVVPDQLSACPEPVPEKLGDQILVFRKGDHAVPQVPRRQHVEVLAQPPARPAVVRDRNYRRQMADEAGNVVAGAGLRSPVTEGTYRLSPRSRVESPVPPPIATTRNLGIDVPVGVRLPAASAAEFIIRLTPECTAPTAVNA